MSIIYNLFIGPLELLFETVFVLANRVIDNPGISIIFLSLAVNFLVIPLYKQADAMQEEERQTEEKLKFWTDHIKKTFKGDERFMMLQTYYRQNNYKPTDALKGSVSLLLEIPFFMAAYNFLSSLSALNGFSFGPIADMGAPDGMLVIGGIAINVLPILMTVINIISGMIYTKGFSLKSKIQLYGMAVIFLVLLYDSPAGLVFYWTLNNVFSLVKNIFVKVKNPKLTISVISSAVSIGMIIYVLFIHPTVTIRRTVFECAFLLMLQLPLIIYFIDKKRTTVHEVTISKQDNFIFYMGCIFLTVLTGFLIPSALIGASPAEFVNSESLTNPVSYIWSALSIAAGLFIVWAGIFYKLASNRSKKLMSMFVWFISGIGVVDYMFFGTNYGTILPDLKFETLPEFALKDQLTNLVCLAFLVAVMAIIWVKKQEIVKVIYISAVLALSGMSVLNVSKINSIATSTISTIVESQKDMATIPLSKNGKNVVVLMLDRAIGRLLPYILQEKPELVEQLDGFTYYPNTISFGLATNFGLPSVMGGFEYTPYEMNKRDTELLETKHDEALKVMPVIFDENGFEVTVCDPTYAGYDWIPDLSIYDEYPDIHKYITKGRFGSLTKEQTLKLENSLRRNFFYFSLFKISPVILQPTIYRQGAYNDTEAIYERALLESGERKDSHLTKEFLDSYNVLKHLTEITNIVDSDKNTFMMMCNETTHEPVLLQRPDYTPAETVNNSEYDNFDNYVIDGVQMNTWNDDQISHYHINVAAFLQLGEWFDYLRENDVYDNTRIILVADHGRRTYHFDDMFYDDGSFETDTLKYNPLLMIKDFNSTGFTKDDTFMMNAITPTLATKGLIDNPVNPFTGNVLPSEPISGTPYIIDSELWDVLENCGTTYRPGTWLTVHDNIFNIENWKVIENPSKN